jgi:hypothetical protein
MEENPNLILTMEAKESGPQIPQSALELSRHTGRYVPPAMLPNRFLDHSEDGETTPSEDENVDCEERAHQVHLTFDTPPKVTGMIKNMEGGGQMHGAGIRVRHWRGLRCPPWNIS